MIELKPCPFCGSKAQSDYILNGNNRRWYSVICVNSKCRCGVFNTEYGYFNAEDATEAWNRRAGEEV